VVGFIRDPTDEQKALFVAVVVMMIADRALWWIDFPFVVRTTAAVGVGFIGLFIASYLLTGQFVPRTRTLTTTSARSTSTRDSRLPISACRSRPVDLGLSISACRSQPPRRRSKPFIPAPPEVAGMPREQKQVRELQEGSYVMMDSSPARSTTTAQQNPENTGAPRRASRARVSSTRRSARSRSRSDIPRTTRRDALLPLMRRPAGIRPHRPGAI